MNVTNEQVYHMTDHTNLNKTATVSDIKRLCDEAREYHAASVCVPPYYVAKAKKFLAESDVKVCTVIGFPNGYSTSEVKAIEATNALSWGAEEIDMVININALKNGYMQAVIDDIKKVRESCNDSKYKNIILKVIIETCLLTDEEIRTMCDICIECGADYIKTSTGFDKAGASVRHIQLMKEYIGDRPLKIKASGGIRTLEDAKQMIKAGADRLGASKIIPTIKEG